MQVIHTAADPKQGRISFEINGCTRNSKQALERIVAPNTSCGARDGEGAATTGAICVAVALTSVYLPFKAL